MRRILVVIAVSLVAIVGWMWWHQRSASLSRPAAERALQKRLHTPYRFSCKRTHEDGSFSGIRNVDYLCEPIGRPKLNGYFIATDAHKITGIQPTG